MGHEDTREGLRLHIGCGKNVIPGWVNIDQYGSGPDVRTDIDPMKLPFDDKSVVEIFAEHVFEHFGLGDEEALWLEMARVLQPGGRLTVEVPDFEWVCRTFLAGEDQWQEFYIVGHKDHYGGFGRSLTQRWGIVQTMFFGNQNGPGQFHRSAYTEGKLRALAAHLEFSNIDVTHRFNKGGMALRAVLIR